MSARRMSSWAAALAVVLGCTDEGREVTAPELGDGPSLSVEDAEWSGPSVTGRVTILGGVDVSSFHAQTTPDGRVEGIFHAINRGQSCGGFTTDRECHVRVIARLDCLVVNGNEAVFGGVFTFVRVGSRVPGVPGLAVGQRVWAKVRDNGEGSGTPPDGFSDWFVDIGGFAGRPTTITACAPHPVVEFPAFIPALLPIESGFVRVRGQVGEQA